MAYTRTAITTTVGQISARLLLLNADLKRYRLGFVTSFPSKKFAPLLLQKSFKKPVVIPVVQMLLSRAVAEFVSVFVCGQN
jgi:hypothetical protein